MYDEHTVDELGQVSELLPIRVSGRHGWPPSLRVLLGQVRRFLLEKALRDYEKTVFRIYSSIDVQLRHMASENGNL